MGGKPRQTFGEVRLFEGYLQLTQGQRRLYIDRLLGEAVNISGDFCRIFVLMPQSGSISLPLIGVVGAGATYRKVRRMFGAFCIRVAGSESWEHVSSVVIAAHQISNDRVTAFLALVKIDASSSGIEVGLGDRFLARVRKPYFHQVVRT